jgi:TonB family protein
MRENDKLRFAMAILFSFLAHITAIVLLFPLFWFFKGFRAILEEGNETIKFALLLAILLHLTLVFPLIHLILTSLPEIDDTEPFIVDLWDGAEGETEREKTPEEELEEYNPAEEIPEGQVVETPPSKDRRRPENARFIAEQDSRVERETKAALQTPYMGDSTSSPELKGTGVHRETRMGVVQEEMVGPPKPSESIEAPEGERTAPLHESLSHGKINLVPSTRSMMAAMTGSGLDHLEDVAVGDATALSAMSWQYASFFNRMKRKVEHRWHPDREYRRRDPYGNIYGFKDRATLLLVILYSDGNIKKIYVMEPSGAPFLDDEAVEAIEQAAPFPNVPSGLIDRRDGLVKFTFHFLVEVGEQPILRMRRYR